MAKPGSFRLSLLRTVNNSRCKLWDVIHRVDTCGEISLSEFDFQSKNQSPGLEYHSHHPRIIRKALNAAGIDFQKYIFVDYGCGKGRVLLIASEFPFRKIIGLEFVPQLADLARRNINRYTGAKQLCREIEVITGDAVGYDLPEEAAFLYFYSPFPPTVMEAVFQNIENSMLKSPRELVVLFTGLPAKRDRAFGRPPYQRVRRDRYFDIFVRHPEPTIARDSH